MRYGDTYCVFYNVIHVFSFQQFWEELASAQGSLHDGLSPESMGSLGGWGGPETLAWVHPLEFATQIAQVGYCRTIFVYLHFVLYVLHPLLS